MEGSDTIFKGTTTGFLEKEVQCGRIQLWPANHGVRRATGLHQPEGGRVGDVLSSLPCIGKFDMSFKFHNFLS